MTQIIHYPNLKTMLMIEKVLKNADTIISREELKKRLPNKVMHQTLNLILDYMEERGLIIDGHKGILWISNTNPKLKKAIEKGREIGSPYKTKEVYHDMKIKNMRKKLKSIFRKYGVIRAGVFGSYARGELKKDSDIDILVEIKDKKMSLLDFVELKLKLEDVLGRKVDLVEYSTIKPRIKEHVLDEEIRII